MKIYSKAAFFSACFSIVIVTLLTGAGISNAALVPTLVLSTTNSNTLVALTVTGADPNGNVVMFYPSAGIMTSTTLGMTNGNGYFTTSIHPSTHNIPAGSPVYILVNGSQSQIQSWPVTVASSVPVTQSASASISFSTSNITMNDDLAFPVTLSGGTAYYVSSNTNPGAVSTSINGSTLTVNSLNPGSAILSVCTNSGNSTSCGSINVTVLGTSSSGDSASSTVVLSPSSVDLLIGQAKTVTINTTKNLTGVYYVGSNSNPNSVTANINGNSLVLTGVMFGGANISICQLGGTQCGSLYVYVSPSSGSTTPSSALPSVAPALTSVSFSSDNLNNNFVGGGVTLTVVWSLNQEIKSTTAGFSGLNMPVYGSGKGPYTAKYTMNTNESASLPVTLTFTNNAGLSGQAKFVISGTPGNSGGVTVTPASSTGKKFVTYLYVGSTGEEVTMLQNYLTKIGIYSGPITGKYGALTEAAVKKYQTKNGLTPIGVVGPATRQLLNNAQ